MLPRVKIFYENGALGSFAPSDDGVFGICVTAKTVVGKFELKKAYVLRSYAGLEDLGCDAVSNPALEKVVREFYLEAGEGTEVWLMGFPDTVTMSDMVDENKDNAKSLLLAADGKLRGLIVCLEPNASYVIKNTKGIDDDVYLAITKGQALAEWSTNIRFAPIFVILEGRNFTGNAVDLTALTTMTNNRVAVVIGDTVAGSKGAAVGLLAGRLAKIPVQRNAGRVKDGALKPIQMWLKDKTANTADVESVHDKGYISFRIFVGKAGYFFSDDHQATKASDDYRHLTNRRVIDKAYRIAYSTLIEELLDEVPVTDTGSLVPAWCANLQGNVEQAIISQMTAYGNLGTDSTDSNDTGVTCLIDYAQNIVSSGRLVVGLRVKPNGYARYIDVQLGFKILK